MYAVFFHAHQKLDKVAHRHLKTLIEKDVFFPSINRILHFEGQRGPDSTNLKNNVNVEQPWHFIDPFDTKDTDLYDLIERHYGQLVEAFTERDLVRSSYECAWLAHALVDGLTPAHHYPYEQELERLRGGETRHNRKGLVGWMYVKGETRRESLRRSYQLLGPKGLLTTHALFEGGAYTIIAPLRMPDALPTRQELVAIRNKGITVTFQRFAREVASHDLYYRFYAHGWTAKLTRDIRRELAPRMVKLIVLAWYSALCDAHLTAEPK
ncbi:MAG TPA: hypothetical protein VF572_01385 [Candidatus Saccharimonadales bacterium]|jgi:hypothetical protein